MHHHSLETEEKEWIGRMPSTATTKTAPEQAAGRLSSSIEEFKVGEALDGGTIGFFFDAGWQVAQDWGNPYLTPGQKIGRGIVAGGVGFVAGLGVAAIVGTGPIGFGVAVGVGWLFEAPASQWIFESFGWIPSRNLAPIN